MLERTGELAVNTGGQDLTFRHNVSADFVFINGALSTSSPLVLNPILPGRIARPEASGQLFPSSPREEDSFSASSDQSPYKTDAQNAIPTGKVAAKIEGFIGVATKAGSSHSSPRSPGKNSRAITTRWPTPNSARGTHLSPAFRDKILEMPTPPQTCNNLFMPHPPSPRSPSQLPPPKTSSSKSLASDELALRSSVSCEKSEFSPRSAQKEPESPSKKPESPPALKPGQATETPAPSSTEHQLARSPRQTLGSPPPSSPPPPPPSPPQPPPPARDKLDLSALSPSEERGGQGQSVTEIKTNFDPQLVGASSPKREGETPPLNRAALVCTSSPNQRKTLGSALGESAAISHLQQTNLQEKKLGSSSKERNSGSSIAEPNPSKQNQNPLNFFLDPTPIKIYSALTCGLACGALVAVAVPSAPITVPAVIIGAGVGAVAGWSIASGSSNKVTKQNEP